MDHFEEVKGNKELKKDLEYVLDLLLFPEKYRKLGVTTPGGILLHGDPGIGKTLIARSFMKASGRKEFICRKDKPNGSFVDHIKATFDDAKANTPSVILLDDMDKFANEDDHHRNAEEYVTVQSCIDEVKGSDVFVLATANNVRSLPDSLVRSGRFDKVIRLRPPKGQDAKEIIAYYLSKKKYVSELDTDFIAKLLDGKSCADLEAVINEAGIYAGYKNKESIDMDDVINACMRLFFQAPECEDADEDNVRKTAYHEAGHAVIAETLEPGSINLVSVRPHNGEIGGVTSFNQAENYFHNKHLMEYRVIALLGGKAATEIVFGETDVGANGDLHRAFDIVTRFVDDYCSTSFDRWEFSHNSSNALLDRKEQNVYHEIEKYYAVAKKILAQNRKLLDRLADELIQKRTIIAPDIEKIKKECPIQTKNVII